LPPAVDRDRPALAPTLAADEPASGARRRHAAAPTAGPLPLAGSSARPNPDICGFSDRTWEAYRRVSGRAIRDSGFHAAPHGYVLACSATAAPSPLTTKTTLESEGESQYGCLKKGQRPPMPTRRSLAGQPSAGKSPCRPAVANGGHCEPSPLGKPGGFLSAHECSQRQSFEGPCLERAGTRSCERASTRSET
jgi:hypothetical protein